MNKNQTITLILILVTISVFIYFIFNSFLTSDTNNTTQKFEDFNIIAVGDWGCLLATEMMVNKINEWDSELILSLGDHSYRETSECWFEKIEPIQENLKISLGNHDTESDSKLQSYMNYFGLENQYYSFNFHNIHFLVLSTELPLSDNSTQYSFAENDLHLAKSDSQIDWIIVFFHKPAYASPNVAHIPDQNFAKQYHPLFEEFQVDLVLQGHMHNYERTFPIKFNQKNYSYPIITDFNKKVYENPEGQIFVTAGTGGALLHSFRGKEPFIVTQFVGFGFLDIQILDDGKTLDAKFYLSDGSIWDNFIIRKFS